jgi:hypothetical protein
MYLIKQRRVSVESFGTEELLIIQAAIGLLELHVSFVWNISEFVV